MHFHSLTYRRQAFQSPIEFCYISALTSANDNIRVSLYLPQDSKPGPAATDAEVGPFEWLHRLAEATSARLLGRSDACTFGADSLRGAANAHIGGSAGASFGRTDL